MQEKPSDDILFSDDTSLGQFSDEFNEMDSFMYCTLEGIGYSTVANEVIKTIRELEQSRKSSSHPYLVDDFYKNRKDHYERLKNFATREIEKGHPYLFSLVCVKSCSILEAAVDSIVVDLFKSFKHEEQSQKLLEMKGPLLPFLNASDDERAAFLRETLMRNIGADLKVGIGRFEAPLSELGLGGFVTSNVRRTLLELTEMRNAIVHRSGKVDNRLLKRCAWLSIKVDDSIFLGLVDYYRYTLAAQWYLIELDQRWREKSGDERKKKSAELQNKLEKFLDDYEPSSTM